MNGIIIFIGVVLILYAGKAIFAPLLVAAFLWYLLNAIAAYYRKAMPWAPPRAAGIAAFMLSLGTFGALCYMFATRIRPAFSGLMARWPEIVSSLRALQGYFSKRFGISLDSSMLPDANSIMADIGSSATQFSAALGLVLVYVFFMYVEQSTFKHKLAALFPSKRQFSKMHFILKSIDGNMKKYMFIKTFVSGLQAALTYFWLQYLGLEFAGVWAFIVFVMNYIPTFGAIVACILPVLYSLLVAPDANMPILVAAGVVGLQVLVGNMLEPKLTGKTLNLSTLAILINLVFWGMLWGPIGMFYSVPLLVATFIITAQFDVTRPIAVLLSANGEIPDKEE
jgi:predicted PurR-regulated permease PerM